MAVLKMKDARIIIIGSGASGITAASHLIVNGFKNVTILEAENRIGGRINTVTFGENCVDLGAHWIHGETGNEVFEMASALDLVESSKDFENVYYALSDGSSIPADVGARMYERCGMILNDNEALKESEGSVAEYITERFSEVCSDIDLSQNIFDAFLDWMLKFECSIEGCDNLWDASAPGLSNYKQCEGDSTVCWKEGGYMTIFNLLMGGGTDAEWVKTHILKNTYFNKEVVQIKWDNSDGTMDEVKVICSDETSYEADYVIVTISLGVLKENAETLFTPSLPEPNITAVNALGIGTVDKIYLYFNRQWWPDDSSGFSFLYMKNFAGNEVSEENWAKDVVGFFTEKNSPKILCGWVVGNSAHEMENRSDDIVIATCMSLIRHFVGHLYTIPEPVSVLRSEWFKNNHFRGSYSYRSMATYELETSASDLAQPLVSGKGNQAVLFAGEATHDCFYSTVHGAIESGRREADRIISIEANLGMKKEVVIVGAGIAGLSAARELLKGGVTNITILEAQSVLGGRVRSVAVEGGHIDLGAQWLHGSSSVLHDIAKDADLLSDLYSEEGAGQYYRESGEEIEHKIVREVADIVEEILDKLKLIQGEPPDSVGQFLNQEFNAYLNKCEDPPNLKQVKQELYNWHVGFQIIDNSCDDLRNLSTKSWGEFDFCGGLNYINFKNGCSSLAEVLARDLPQTVLRLNCPVVQIKWCEEIGDLSTPPCSVMCEDGTEYQTNHIIVTPSVGFLKSSPNFFKPPIPHEYQKALNGIGFDVINKVFLIYEKPWWKKDLKGLQFAWSHLDDGNESVGEEGWTRCLTGFDAMVNLPNILVGWVGGRGARTIEEMPPSVIGDHCTQLFRRATCRNDIPKPSRIIRSQWGKNVFVQGGYSHILKSADKEGIDVTSCLLQPITTKLVKLGSQHPTILFAGEAMHKAHYSTIHGANESGKDQAAVLLQYLGNKN